MHERGFLSPRGLNVVNFVPVVLFLVLPFSPPQPTISMEGGGKGGRGKALFGGGGGGGGRERGRKKYRRKGKMREKRGQAKREQERYCAASTRRR